MINWKKVKVLDSKTQTELAKLAQEGDDQARDQLIESCMKLASKVAWQKSLTANQAAELQSEAFLAVVESVDSFDTERGTGFTTHLHWHFNRRLYKFLIENSTIVRFSTRKDNRKVFFNLSRIRAKFAKQGVLNPMPESIAAALDVTVESVLDVMRVLSGAVSMQAPSTEEGNTTFGDTVSDGSPNEAIEHKDEIEWLRKQSDLFLDTLKPLEQVIWTRRVMKEEGLQAIADDIGISKQYIGRIEHILRATFIKRCKWAAK